MGLYKYKCHKQPVWVQVFRKKQQDLVIYYDMAELNNMRCDFSVPPPQEAIDAYNAYYESKRWFEHGCYCKETGLIKDNNCIHFNFVRQANPSEDEPGNKKRCCDIVSNISRALFFSISLCCAYICCCRF